MSTTGNKPMKANAGGQIAPDEIIGRDDFIADLWEILERQSFVLSQARRIGKTSIVKKMEAEAIEDKIAIYRDLEGVRSPLEFVRVVLQDVESYLSRFQKTTGRVRTFLEKLGGVEIGKIIKIPEIAAPDWKFLLNETIADLVENQESQVIFFWDEMPYMLDNIGNKEAMEMLDVLREIRHQYPDVRMVFTGSIGLHHIVTNLRKEVYSNDPLNDMQSQDVPTLSAIDAIELARLLLLGENIDTSNIEATATAIATAVNYIPFYIHHLVLKLKQRRTAVSADLIPEIIEDCLLDPLNPWSMEHYRDRIDNYYNLEQKNYALNILDILANIDRSLLFDELLNRLSLQLEIIDKEIARQVLKLLERDYYLIRQRDLTYSFRYSLIQRYWQLSRG